MRLFHVSEEADIKVFEPRFPKRKDLDPNIGLVWAIDEERLPNFLTPRDCPRVAYHVGPQTSENDKKRFFTFSDVTQAVVMESSWYTILKNTTLYLYEFETDDFVLQDPVAGYYVATKTQFPKERFVLTDLLGELAKRNVEIRLTGHLWSIAEAIKASTLNWSLCRMANAARRP